jgi:hypothetical protein
MVTFLRSYSLLRVRGYPVIFIVNLKVEARAALLFKYDYKERESSVIFLKKYIMHFQYSSYTNKKSLLHQNRLGTVPNLLCAFRIALSPIVAATILHQKYSASLILFALAAITDLVHAKIIKVGYISRMLKTNYPRS